MFIWIPIFPGRLHRELLCFVKCFMVIPNDLFNQLWWILWSCCDKYGEFIVNIWGKNSSNLYIYIISYTPTFYSSFWKYKATLTILLKFSGSLIVKKISLLVKLLNPEKKDFLSSERSIFNKIFGSKFKTLPQFIYFFIYPA